MPALDLGAYARDMGARDAGSPTLTHRRTLHALPLLPSLHTQGIKQESIQGTVPTACAGSRGKNSTTSLFLPKMKQESGSRALGAGETGLGHKADDEAPMWGTGRTPASLHVHTTGLCWASRAASGSEKSFGAGWLAKPTRPL